MITAMKWLGTLILTLCLLVAMPYVIKTLKEALKTARILTGKEG